MDDHEVVREGLVTALSTEADLRVVGAVSTATSALAEVTGLQPDVALVDVRLSDMSGIELCALLRQAAPSTAVVILSTYLSEQYVREALEAGASGYVTKAVGLSELRATIRRAVGAEGANFAEPAQIVGQLKQILNARMDAGAPSEQQRRILELAAKGFTDADIGRTLFISRSTVRFHIQRLKLRFDARSKTELIFKAVQAGMVAIDDHEGP